jgi:RNA polymerase sigma-70 factor (ECF subfamily)
MSPRTADREQFEHVTYPLGDQLFRVAFWRLGNTQDAEDVVQETYLRAFRSFHTYRAESNAKAWMMTILFNAINDFYARRGRSLDNGAERFDDDANRLEESVADASIGGGDPSELLMRDELPSELLRALRALPSALLQPLLLRELEEMSYEQIATVMGVPIGTVMSRLFRARRVVRERLNEEKARTQRASKERGGR